MDASPVTGRADDFEHLLLYMCLLFSEVYFRRGSVMDACTFLSLGAVRTLESIHI
jgi:hypothetical protein